MYNPGKRQLHSLSIVDYPKLSMLTTLSRFNSKYEIKVNVKDPLPLAKEQVLELNGPRDLGPCGFFC